MRRHLRLLAAALLVSQAVPSWAKPPKKAPKDPATSEGEAAKPGGKEPSLLEPDTSLIDVPTAGILDVGGFSTQTRFFSQGGVLEWLNFGVVHRVNLGASMNVEKLIGTGSPVQITRPELQIKFRFYDGDRLIPAFALGFDGQGYLYSRPDKQYNQRQRGLYVAGSQEIVWPGLQGHFGMNISDFDSNAIFGFMALGLDIQDKVTLMAEWDNIQDVFNSRINLGFKVHVTPNAHVGFSARAVGAGGDYPNGVARGAERVFQFKFTGNF